MQKQLVIIGGGAAGFFCAVNAARMNAALKVIIVEKSNKLLSKVKVSGGGRCNVTHACFNIGEMVKRYPRGANFVKKTFHQFFTTDTIEWFEARSVKLKAEADGRMFPVTDSSQTIIDCLLKEANKYHVEIWMQAEVKAISIVNGQWSIAFADNRKLNADYVVVASGGYPKTAMFDWIKNIGHSIEEPVPSLFTFNLPKHPITQLMGVSVEQAKVKIAGIKTEQTGPVMITHWGLSGPAILKMSAWAARELQQKNWEFEVMINWVPEYNEQQLINKFQQLRFEQAAQKISNKNVFGLPQRLWQFFLEQAGIVQEKRWADLAAKEQNKLAKLLCNYTVQVKGKTTFKEEFVTAGGIKLNEIDANTMMSKKADNLFFAGEVIDVDGITGGYNFQNAWTTGWVAAKGISKLANGDSEI